MQLDPTLTPVGCRVRPETQPRVQLAALSLAAPRKRNYSNFLIYRPKLISHEDNKGTAAYAPFF